MPDEAYGYVMTKKADRIMVSQKMRRRKKEVKTVLFIAALLIFIGVGSAVLYSIGEVIVNQQDATSYGGTGRKERKDGRTKKSEP